MPKSRQHWGSPLAHPRFKAALIALLGFALINLAAPAWAALPQGNAVTVSYTHLTLPTTPYV